MRIRSTPNKPVRIELADLEMLMGYLGDEELGVAIRLVAHQMRSGEPIPMNIAHTRIGIAERRMRRIAGSLRSVFDTTDDCWSFAPVAKRVVARRSTTMVRREAAKSRWTSTVTDDNGDDAIEINAAHETPPDAAPIVAPSHLQSSEDNQTDIASSDEPEPAPTAGAVSTGLASRAIAFDGSVQQPGTPEAPHAPTAPYRSGTPSPTGDPSESGTPTLFALPEIEKPAPAPTKPAVRKSGSDGAPMKSLKSNIYDMGIQMLTASGKSESSARACIARLLKDHDMGYVATAISETWERRENIVDPFSWIRGLLKKYPTRSEEKAARSTAGGRIAAPSKRTAHPLATPETLGISAGMAQTIAANRARRRTFDYQDAP